MRMILGQKGVKYGLQVRQPEQNTKPKKVEKLQKPSAFGDDESDDEEFQNVERQIARHAARKQDDKKVAELHAAALAEDASVFDYDSHFDKIQQERSAPKQQDKIERRSRYIGSLLEQAAVRKREQDVLFERKLVKEREAEDYLFGEKERFITSAYKKKLQEDAKWNEDRRRQEEEEERNAVERKGHMGDFYRNILRGNVAFGTAPSSTTITATKGDNGLLKIEKSEEEEEEERKELPKKVSPLQQPSRPSLQVQEERADGNEHLTATHAREGGAGGGALRGGKNRAEAVEAARQRYLERKRKAEGLPE